MTSFKKPHYVLKIFLDSSDTELVNLYKKAVEKNNKVLEPYFLPNTDYNAAVHFDAGFDLFCPEQLIVMGVGKVDHKVKTAMEFVRLDNNNRQLSVQPVGYYLYSRSSTGTKTPLRLANSVGIIDSGYRGNIIAVFDNIQDESFTIEPYQRLAQLCPPNLTYPIYVRMVNCEADLGLTLRGSQGFGSSGK